MRKQSFVIATTLTLLASGLAPTTVWADDLEGANSWSYQEMAGLNVSMSQEIAENCLDDDPMCGESYIYNKEGDIYHALRHYRERGLTITSIDPYNHTVKVAYDSGLLSDGPSSQQLTVKDLYIVQPKIGYVASNYARAIDNGNQAELENLELLFVKNDASSDDAWFPSGTEIELSVPNLSIISNTQAKLDVFYRMSVSYIAWQDYFDFSECLASLEEGMECRVMYNADRYYYAPTKVESSAKTLSTHLGSASLAVEASDMTENETDQSADSAQSPQNGSSAGNDAENSVGAPNTGSLTREQNQGSVELPWWLGAIASIGVATLIWFFWPNCQKKSKKS